jgi:DGQHR domain-containing protein
MRERFGSVVVLENCIVGQNLNLLSIRGFARLHVLAAISAPDIFDQRENPMGTQRDLNVKRSRDALDYAMASVNETPDAYPRAFTEVILNVRDRSVISIIDLEDDSEIEFSSTDALEDVRARRVQVRIDLSSMPDPQPNFDPLISRVDGNHRLSAVLDEDDELLNDESNLPFIAFALFIGLSANQERAVFRDINSKQAKMETAHLDQISIALDENRLLHDTHKQSWALWVANQLTQPGHVFEGQVFFGGSKKGLKAAGIKPLLRINALRDTVRYSINDDIEKQFFILDPIKTQQMSKEQQEREVEHMAKVFAQLLQWYWSAVRLAFPAGWQNKQDYILFQSIGLYAFGALAANLIKVGIEKGQLTQAYFESVLSELSKRVDLAKTNPAWEGVAGLAGGKKVLKALEGAIDLPSANLGLLREQILGRQSPLES